MIVQVLGTEGQVTIDGEYGTIIEINGVWTPETAPSQFDVSEYRRHFGVPDLPPSIDILNIGYWFGAGQYCAPLRGEPEADPYPVALLFGASFGSFVVTQPLLERQVKLLGQVCTVDGMEVWHLPHGYFCHLAKLQGVFHADGKEESARGQLLAKMHGSAVLWHIDLLHHHELYAKTTALVADKERLRKLLHDRPHPVTEEFLHGTMSVTREILLRQIESVLDELSKDAQCIVCEEYFDRKSMLKATEGGLLCPACYNKHYVVCFDCNKLTERRKAKYHTDLAYCPTCYLWMQHMGFV